MSVEIRENFNPIQTRLDEITLRRLVEHAPSLLWIADTAGYIYWYSPGWYAYTGKTPAEMQGWGWQSVHEPRHLAAVLDRWKAGIASGAAFDLILNVLGADGVVRPFLTRIRPAFDDEGRLANWFGVNTDISQLGEAKGAAHEQEARFRVIADLMPQMVWSAAPDGGHDYHNARWFEFTGTPVGATDGEGWISLLHPDETARVVGEWRRSVELRLPYHCEHRLRSKSGDYRWVLARASAEVDAQGEAQRWFGTYTDIEDLVNARALIQRSREELEREVAERTGERNLLATLVERTDLLVMAIDQQHTVLAINKANADEVERIYGKRPKVGDNILALLADQPERQEAVRQGWARGLAGEDLTFTDVRGDPARGAAHYEFKIRALRDDAGTVIGAFQFVENVTGRVRSQAMLAQAQEALLQSRKLEGMGQLTGGVAHDFNNLLTPILGTLDMLLRRGVGGPREQRLIKGAFQSAERAKVLVHRLLAFARRQPLQSTPTDLRAVLIGMADLVRGAVGPNVDMALEAPDHPLWAKVDRHQLELAILNLCVNARDALRGQGRLTLSLSAEVPPPDGAPALKPGRYVRLSVSDTGIGMDEETRARAIEPFFSTKGVGKGTGLGLSMAHGLASQLDGALTIESAPHVGTQVSIWLPESPAAEVRPAAPKPSPIRRFADFTAVLVDDEEDIRASAADMLNDLGFSVHEYASADEALSAIRGGLGADIVITDHLMPGMTGLELAGLVRESAPHVKVLLVSGFAEFDGVDASVPRLIKPFVQSDLAEAVSTLGLACRSGRSAAV
jgi:PAS domain S-box-containing protein